MRSWASKGHKDGASVLSWLNARVSGLPQLVGFRVDEVDHGRLIASLDIKPFHLAANGYLHAGTIVTLADTACGYGCFASLPRDRANFTTTNLSCQFLGTTLEGELLVEAMLRHAGRSTQVWDAEVRVPALSEANTKAKTIALFRCTQLLLDERGKDSQSQQPRAKDNEDRS